MKQIKSALDNIKFQQSYNTIHDYTNEFLKLEKLNKVKMYGHLVNIYMVVNQLSKEFYIKKILK